MPGSWELVALRENRILLSIIVPPDLKVSLDFTQDVAAFQLPPGSNFLRVVNLPFGPARNQAAKTALENGYHLAFLDADIRAPKDAFIRLLETKLDIVGGLYYQRFPPYMPVMFNEGKDDKGNPVRVLPTGWKPGDLVPVTFLPSGLTLYRRRLLEAMFARFPRPFEWGHDIAPTPSESGTAPPFCVLPGQEVFGASPIEQIDAGTKILDQNGRYSAVAAKWEKTYSGKVLDVLPRCLRVPFTVTPEHQVLVKLDRICQSLWLEAKNLKKGMYLAFPRPANKNIALLDLSEWLGKPQDSCFYEAFTRREGDFQRIVRENRIPSAIPLTPEFLELCGWFAAEGSTAEDKRDGQAKDIRFSLGPHELQQARWLLETFRNTFQATGGKVTQGTHAWAVVFRSGLLYKLFRAWFGVGAYNKRLPPWVLELNEEQAVHFLRGLWHGDGHQTYSGRPPRLVMCYRTASKTLAWGVVALLVKLGIRPTLRVYRQHATSYAKVKGELCHIVVYYDSAKLCRLVQWPISERLPRWTIERSFLEDGKFWFPVERVATREYEGLVYDLTVERGHSYVLGPAIVHNSEDFTMSWRAKQLGFQPYCHTGLVGLHEVSAVVGPKWMIPLPSPDPLHGSIAVISRDEGGLGI